MMHEIDSLRERLEAAASSDDGVAGTLEAAWDAFGLLLVSCRQCEERSVELFAAFAFAATTAANGRHLIWAAPSLPPACGTGTSQPVSVMADLEEIADKLAGLAHALSSSLSSAARRAVGPGDQGACTDAALEAGRIYELLARDGS